MTNIKTDKEKIFDPAVQAYLKDAGVEDQYINAKMHEVAKKNVLNALQAVIDRIKNEEYEYINNHTDHSPAGDDMGCDNSYISFANCFGNMKKHNSHDNSCDIEQAAQLLKQFKDKSKKK